MNHPNVSACAYVLNGIILSGIYYSNIKFQKSINNNKNKLNMEIYFEKVNPKKYGNFINFPPSDTK